MRKALVLLALVLTACSTADESGKPVPIGDKAALHHLADEYTKLAEQVPVSPMRLPPDKRKDFVVKVFAASGYSYSSTLHQMAAGGWDVNDQNARDLVELLFMPHTNVSAPRGWRAFIPNRKWRTCARFRR